MAFKLKSSSPLRVETDPKLKFKEFDSKKVKYSTNVFLKPGVNTYEKDAAQLKSDPYKPYTKNFSGLKKDQNSYASIRANKRMTSFKERGGTTSAPSVKATAPKDMKPLSAGDGVRKTKVSKPKVTKTPTFDGGINQAKNKKALPDPPKKRSFKSAYDKRDKKIYGNLSQSQFTTESKRQMASKKAGKGYDAPKKQMGKVRKKVEAVKPMKAAGSDVKRQTPKLAGDVRTKAQKLRAKGEGILANKKLSTRQKQKQAGSVRKQYDAEIATQKKKKPVVEVKKKEVVKKKSNERFMF